MTRPVDRLDLALLLLLAVVAWERNNPAPLLLAALLIAFVGPFLQWAGMWLVTAVVRRRRLGRSTWQGGYEKKVSRLSRDS